MADSEKKTLLSWFAMRDFTRPNAKQPAYKSLAQEGIEVFTPMKEQLKIKNGRRIRENVPVLHDLLFVHSTREVLDPIVSKTETLQYRYKKGVQRTPITIEEREMQQFLCAVHSSERVRYYLPGEITPDMYGQQVRIVGGALDGMEGRLLKIRGSKTKHLLVEMQGIMAATVEVAPEYIIIV